MRGCVVGSLARLCQIYGGVAFSRLKTFCLWASIRSASNSRQISNLRQFDTVGSVNPERVGNFAIAFTVKRHLAGYPYYIFCIYAFWHAKFPFSVKISVSNDCSSEMLLIHRHPELLQLYIKTFDFI